MSRSTSPSPLSSLRRALRARAEDRDAGIGMILVIGTAVVIMALVVVSGSVVKRSLSTSTERQRYSQAIALAENGIDQALARVQAAYDAHGETYVTPSDGGSLTPDCIGDPAEFAFDLPAGASEEAERVWARDRLEAVAALGEDCLRSTPEGEYAVLVPGNRQAVYSMGWVPSKAEYDAGRGRARLVKAEYIFAPYKPATAIQTGGDIKVNSSATVTGATSAANSQAGIHSNGNVIVTNGNPTVTGQVSMSGSGALPSSNKFTGGVVRARQQALPTVNARTLYTRHVGSYPGAWYDLCPDGTARYGSVNGPCTGTVIRNMKTQPSPRFNQGWSFIDGTVPTWQLDRGLETSGIYYVSEGNMKTGTANTPDPIPNLTVIASSVGGVACDKVGGNIDWRAIDAAAPYLDGLFLMADQDIRVDSNSYLGKPVAGNIMSGMVVAGDQVHLNTSSNEIYGSVVAQDKGDPSGSLVDENEIKNAEVRYDPTGYSPFTSIVNTTLWLEYAVGR